MSGLKKLLKSNFWGNYLISLSHCVRCKIEPALISDEKAVKKYYKKRFGKDLDLNNPETFSEKINWYKLNDRNPLMTQCADKVAVRDYITEKGYGDCLNEIYGVYDKVEDIDIESLPDQFVIKAAHGSHMNYIVKDKKTFDWKHAKKMMKTWLHQDIYWSGREWVYKQIPKRIIIEKYLEDDKGELRDYKFFCFHGKPIYMECVTGRYTKNYHMNFFDMKMKFMDFSVAESSPDYNKQSLDIDICMFQRMMKVAESLSSPFQQARIDLYCVRDSIVIGEITFFHDGGSTVFIPDEWNTKFSENWSIINKQESKRHI